MPKNLTSSSKTLLVVDRSEWRAWLESHAASESEVWLVFYKAHTGQSRIPYDDAVEEALCFGWIDSIIQRIDEEKYAQKFTPRKDWAKWSESNRQRLRKLQPLGLIQPNVLARIPPEIFNAAIPAPQHPTPEMPDWFARALEASPAAKANFWRFSERQRRLYLLWLCDAKREETRQKRIAEAIVQLERGQELGMK
jgi:uncharacterized protein YdeI (YjbR/CyaY-like superfamily)